MLCLLSITKRSSRRRSGVGHMVVCCRMGRAHSSSADGNVSIGSRGLAQQPHGYRDEWHAQGALPEATRWHLSSACWRIEGPGPSPHTTWRRLLAKGVGAGRRSAHCGRKKRARCEHRRTGTSVCAHERQYRLVARRSRSWGPASQKSYAGPIRILEQMGPWSEGGGAHDLAEIGLTELGFGRRAVPAVPSDANFQASRWPGDLKILIRRIQRC